MGYLFLAIALFTGTLKGYCGKRVSQIITGMQETLLANLVRMFLCCVIGLGILLAGQNTALLFSSHKLILLSAMSGISTAMFVVLWLILVKRGAYMLVEVFLMLGILIPLLAGTVLYREQIQPVQWLGMLILFGAVLLMCSYNNSVNRKLSLSSVVLLILCGASSGITDLSQKMFVYSLPGFPISVFNFYTYCFAALTLAILLPFFSRRPAGETQPETSSIQPALKTAPGLWTSLFRSLPAGSLPYILTMSVCLFLNSYFKTVAAGYLDAVLLYPINQAAALTLSSLMAAFIFHEKLTPKGIAGLLLAFIGILCINVLA